MSRASLRLVRPPPPRRPSVIVDMTRDDVEPRHTCPWSMAEILRAHAAPVPQVIVSGMYLAAVAAAEHCDLLVTEGRLEASGRYSPSESLYAMIGEGIGGAVGVLGFGLPVRLRVDPDGTRHVYISWARSFEHGRS